MKIIAHLDLDCFFVSCERIKHPELAGKPAIVGGSASGRGVVASPSYEARKFGVRSAMPSKRAMELCPNAIFLTPDLDFYSEMSHRVRRYLRETAPVVEQASIDEFYLDISGCERIYPEPLQFGAIIKGYLSTALKLPSTVGISTSKLVSKIAAAEAKPDGLSYILAGKEQAFLSTLPVEAMPGIGKVTAREMHRFSFKTLGQIALAEDSFLIRCFGKWGAEFKKSAEGIDDSPVTSWEDPKSFGRETTFEKDEANQDYLLSVLSSFAEECCAELRRYHFKAKTVTVKFRLPDFKTFERSKTIFSTANEKDIFLTAKKLFLGYGTKQTKFRLIGLSVSNLTAAKKAETLFSEPEDEKWERIDKHIDTIRHKYGLEAIQLGSSLKVK